MNAIELYKSSSGEMQIEVRFEKETVWLTLNQMAELFGRDKSVISRQLKNVYKEKELDFSSTIAKNAIVQFEGQRKVERKILILLFLLNVKNFYTTCKTKTN
jgi:hypothetical protein